MLLQRLALAENVTAQLSQCFGRLRPDVVVLLQCLASAEDGTAR
ncbi:hypothetical protein OWR29_02265 [Actinoplanes sp. Pm04-4]|uniref:Uncharacterized protein n=1 Tax=Paractinoplanes pyxinae TaxID=2997416 RepID=A0ABT4ARF3_9ACTN|nr:hypothetical protein [Actinoplanes pyxinae]MCY1136806.1 hypothetical protein [Actinoplanes pyxinae]